MSRRSAPARDRIKPHENPVGQPVAAVFHEHHQDQLDYDMRKRLGAGIAKAIDPLDRFKGDLFEAPDQAASVPQNAALQPDGRYRYRVKMRPPGPGAVPAGWEHGRFADGSRGWDHG